MSFKSDPSSAASRLGVDAMASAGPRFQERRAVRSGLSRPSSSADGFPRSHGLHGGAPCSGAPPERAAPIGLPHRCSGVADTDHGRGLCTATRVVARGSAMNTGVTLVFIPRKPLRPDVRRALRDCCDGPPINVHPHLCLTLVNHDCLKATSAAAF